MLEMKIVREEPERVRKMLRDRNMTISMDPLLRADDERRRVISEVQTLKERRNRVSREISSIKKTGDVPPALLQEMKEISESISRGDERIRTLEVELSGLLSSLPNIPHDSVPIGSDSSGNVIARRWGSATAFPFPVKDHIDLAVGMDLIDVERAAKTSGSRFYILKRDLVALNQAVIRYALDFITQKGFTMVQPPYMLKRDALSGAVILSDFEDTIYKIEGEDLYLIGTSEHAIAAMHMNEIFSADDLPLRYAGISPCFRKEAGAHGRDTKGIFRVHQFEKVEQFSFTKPEESWDELEFLLSNAEEFMRSLEIPYQVVVLCTGDLGKVAAKTYDIEAWMPGQGAYREVISCSNCTDFQARGLGTKFRRKPHEKAEFVHTLNSTLAATERTIIGILENNQTADGMVKIPERLRPYMGGMTTIAGGRAIHTT